MTLNIKFKMYILWFVGVIAVIAVMPYVARADVIDDAVAKGYDAGFKKGYQKGFVEGQKSAPGGGTQNDIVLSKSKDGGFGTGGGTTFMKKSAVGFLWDWKEKNWQAYKLDGVNGNTVVPGTGLNIEKWAKSPELWQNSDIKPTELKPELENLSKEFTTKYPESNIFIMPGQTAQ